MTYNLYRMICVFFCFCVISQITMADLNFDREREQLIADRLSGQSSVGEAISLEAGDHEFFALYANQTHYQEKGAIVLLHPMAGHPDWPGVIRFLREFFPEHGWSTLSIQLPIIEADEPLEDYGQTFEHTMIRVNAAVEYLKQQGYQHIVVSGHGFGAVSGVYALTKGNRGVLGLIGIGMDEYPYLLPKFSLLKELEKLNLPVLDVYGSMDRETIIEGAPDRRLAAGKAENVYYKQVMIGGADHSFSNQEVILAKRMLAWLDELIAKMTLSQDN